MKKLVVSFLGGCALLATMAWASDASKSVTGIVVKITSSAIAVRPSGGKPIMLMTDRNTTYQSLSHENVAKPGVRDEIRVGEQIMIQTEEKNGKMEAVSVQYMPNNDERN